MSGGNSWPQQWRRDDKKLPGPLVPRLPGPGGGWARLGRRGGGVSCSHQDHGCPPSLAVGLPPSALPSLATWGYSVTYFHTRSLMSMSNPEGLRTFFHLLWIQFTFVDEGIDRDVALWNLLGPILQRVREIFFFQSVQRLEVWKTCVNPHLIRKTPVLKANE